MKPTTVLPDDPALPGLAAIRVAGLARAVPALGLDGGSVELVLRAYQPGSHATLEARAARRRFAVKAYADDPAPEAALYEAIAAGLVGDSRIRVPPLLARERDLRLLVVAWLEGPTAHELLRRGQGLPRPGREAAVALRANLPCRRAQGSRRACAAWPPHNPRPR